MKMPSSAAGEAFVLSADQPVLVRNVDERLVSYNIEMTEITGGTFWKSYTPEQIAGTEEFPVVGPLRDVTSMPDLTQYYPPIDLYHDRLRGLAKKLGPAWVRVSGTWATKTYYDFDDVTGGKAPVGYASVLTREQWIGVLDFVRYVGAKLLISVSNCAGDHPDGGPLDLTQAKKIFDFSHSYGVEIDAVEFMNEPNMLGCPAHLRATRRRTTPVIRISCTPGSGQTTPTAFWSVPAPQATPPPSARKAGDLAPESEVYPTSAPQRSCWREPP